MKTRPAGLSTWLVQRVSAVYMLLFMVFCLGSWWLIPFSSYADWKNGVARPGMTLALALFFVALLSHMWVGLRDVLLDYARPAGLRQFLLVLVAAQPCSKAIMKFSISRYNPEHDAKPYLQDYEIELIHSDHMLLDVLLRLKQQDNTLTMRKSCREGVCGSDAMNINGRNGLACITRVRELTEPVVLRPLPSFPIVRDLVVDMTGFFKQYHSIKPYLMNAEPPPEKERLQSPEERSKLNGAYECILCACCSSQCPSFWWNPDKFVGPAGLLQAYRFIFDSRDDAAEARLDDLNDAYRLFRCRTIMNCSEVCPKGLEPAHAIEMIRLKMLKVEGKGGLPVHRVPTIK